METSFIPPPYPFPEAWPRVFAKQQQRQSSEWLTPWTLVPIQCQEPPATEAQHPNPNVSPTATWFPDEVAIDEEDKEDDEEEEFEYGFVLSDEWRQRFRSSGRQLVPTQQQPRRAKGKKKRQRKKLQQKQVEAQAAASAGLSDQLQREIQAAKSRELVLKWKRRSTSSSSDTSPAIRKQIEAMETSLNVLFDDFCDAFQPVVWPAP